MMHALPENNQAKYQNAVLLMLFWKMDHPRIKIITANPYPYSWGQGLFFTITPF